MDEDDTVDENTVVWEKRAVLMTAFGLAGFGTLFGAISVYIRYLKHIIAQHFHIKSVNISQIRESTGVEDPDGALERSSIISVAPKSGETDARRSGVTTGSAETIAIPSTITGRTSAYNE